jgi:hypothetical protein
MGEQESVYAHNIHVDGDAYLKGDLGLKWFPSQEAKTNAANYETWVNQTLAMLWSKFTGSRVIMAISGKSTQGKIVTIRPRDSSPDPTKMFDKFIPEKDRMCNAEAQPIHFASVQIPASFATLGEAKKFFNASRSKRLSTLPRSALRFHAVCMIMLSSQAQAIQDSPLFKVTGGRHGIEGRSVFSA